MANKRNESKWLRAAIDERAPRLDSDPDAD
jgi:hypothetical protein